MCFQKGMILGQQILCSILQSDLRQASLRAGKRKFFLQADGCEFKRQMKDFLVLELCLFLVCLE